jgi:N-formylglutamate amidohydrolase
MRGLFTASGGIIPGGGGQPAFHTLAETPTSIPVIIAVPHAGRAYSDSLLGQMRNPGLSCLRLEDRHADQIGIAVARGSGGALIVANAPRALIDLNRSVDDVDWTMVSGGRPADAAPNPSTGRAKSGLGLVPCRLGGIGEIWNGKLGRADLDARIANVHRPYHAALAALLEQVRARWGAVLLLDIHSMPPLLPQSLRQQAQLVIGDRFGGACAGALVASVFDHLAGEGLSIAYNRPYAGGYVLDRHGAPIRGVHAIQIEICRSLYLDSRLDQVTEGLQSVANVLTRLVNELSGRIVQMGKGAAGRWGVAAE